jgi:tRNA-dihydrouridine synthase 1
LEECVTLREALAKGSTLEDLKTMAHDLEKHFLPYYSGEKVWSPPTDSPLSQLPFPPWLCQPYVRPPPEDHLKKMELINSEMKRVRESDPQDLPEGTISKKKMKKLAKKPGKQFRVGREVLARCSNCPNPLVSTVTLENLCSFSFISCSALIRAESVYTTCVKSAAETNATMKT